MFPSQTSKGVQDYEKRANDLWRWQSQDAQLCRDWSPWDKAENFFNNRRRVRAQISTNFKFLLEYDWYWLARRVSAGVCSGKPVPVSSVEQTTLETWLNRGHMRRRLGPGQRRRRQRTSTWRYLFSSQVGLPQSRAPDVPPNQRILWLKVISDHLLINSH